MCGASNSTMTTRSWSPVVHKFEPLILCPHRRVSPLPRNYFIKYRWNVRFSERICKMYDNTVAKALCKKLRSQVCTFEFLPLCLKDFHFNFSQIFISLSGGGGGGGGGEGVHVTLFLWNRLACSSVPSNFVFLYSLFPNIVSVPLKIGPFFLCSPEINALFPCSPKPLRMPHMHLTDRPGQWAQQSKRKILHIVWLQSNQIG